MLDHSEFSEFLRYLTWLPTIPKQFYLQITRHDDGMPWVELGSRRAAVASQFTITLKVVIESGWSESWPRPRDSEMT